MRFTEPDENLIYPEASVTGETGILFDTGWDINWPGPGRLYLGPRDLADIVGHALDVPNVLEVLATRGWTRPSETDGRVADLERQLADALLDLETALADKNALAQSIRILNGDPIADEHEAELAPDLAGAT